MPAYLAISLGFYVLATALGLVLRYFLVAPFPGIVFSHWLHAHSHTLYFGWAALGIFALLFRQHGTEPKAQRWILGAIAALALASFISFLEGGYSVASIVISSLSLPLWLVAGTTVLCSVKGERSLAASYARVGMAYLFLSSLGAVARVVVLVAKVQDPLWGRLAVFGFLFCFAWFFVFSLLSLLLSHQRSLQASFDERRLGWHLRLAAPAAWLTFPLGVAGGSVGWIGVVAKAAALYLLIPGAIAAWTIWRAPAKGSPARWWLRLIGFWMASTAALEGVGALGVAEAAVASRHLAVLYLHVLLVGLVTSSLVLLTLTRLGISPRATALHHGGLAIMLLGLGLAGAPALLEVPTWLPRLGLIVALVGGALAALAGGLFFAAFAKGWGGLRRPVPTEGMIAGGDP